MRGNGVAANWTVLVAGSEPPQYAGLAEAMAARCDHWRRDRAQADWAL
jgi:hypothetical protein